MALSYVDLAGSAAQSNFGFSIPYISRDHLSVYIDGDLTTDFTFQSAFVITLDTPLADDATVRIARVTPIDEPLVDYSNGAVLGETDLDTEVLQGLYRAQEMEDWRDNIVAVSDDDGQMDAHSRIIKNVLDPIDPQHAATKAYADSLVLGGSLTNVPLITPTITNPTVTTGTFTSPVITTPAITGGTQVGPTITDAILSVKTYLFASLPAGVVGQLAWVTNAVRGLYLKSAAGWMGLFGHYDARYFGADPTGVADSFSAIQAALTAAGANGRVRLPQGTYKVTDALVIADDRVTLDGDGPYATKILFVPTAAKTCLTLTKPTAALINQCTVKNLCIYSTDSTYVKIGIDIIDASSVKIENVVIGGSITVGGADYFSDSTKASIGIRTQGREFGLFDNVYVYADRPLVIADNPNSNLDCDHYNFHDMYLGASDENPVVEVLDGVNLSNVSFTGAQPWVGGTHGFYWADTTGSQVSNNILLENIRWEQTNDAANSWYVYISKPSAGKVQGLTIRNTYGDDRKGFYFRYCQQVLLDTIFYTSATKEGLNIDSTVSEIECRNGFWQAGSTADVTGQKVVYEHPKFPNSGCLPPSFRYTNESNAKNDVFTDCGLMGQQIPLADNATHTICTNTAVGLLIVLRDNGTVAQFNLQGGNNSTAEVSDSAGQFSVAAGTGTSTNVYHSGGNYILQNKTGGAAVYRVLFLGVYDGV